jgi:hypothetical protein
MATRLAFGTGNDNCSPRKQLFQIGNIREGSKTGAWLTYGGQGVKSGGTP